MPIVFIMNDMGIRTNILVLDKPSKVRPNSSGKGDAIINAPRIGDNHFKNPKCNECKIFFTIEGLSEFIRSLANLSRIKVKSKRSPQVAPKAPIIATICGETPCPICESTIADGAIVNAEVKNIPAIKLAIISLPNKLTTHCKNPICESNNAITAPTMMKPKSLNNSLLADTIDMGKL